MEFTHYEKSFIIPEESTFTSIIYGINCCFHFLNVILAKEVFGNDS